jgi:hypothetical protein
MHVVGRRQSQEFDRCRTRHAAHDFRELDEAVWRIEDVAVLYDADRSLQDEKNPIGK